LYFADPNRRTLILDSIVAGWLQTKTGRRFYCNRNSREYAMWLRLASDWGSELHLTPEQVELLIFTDALPEGSQWSPV
jgi:hypothetical protein